MVMVNESAKKVGLEWMVARSSYGGTTLVINMNVAQSFTSLTNINGLKKSIGHSVV